MRGLVFAIALLAVACGSARAADKPKNWTPPSGKIYGQTLVDETMKAHPELLSMTLHGVPPGTTDVYTMFAGSYPDRIGNADDPDDIDVSKKGITILDPRWHRTNDPAPKFVVLMPLRDKAGENVGLVVYAFKRPAGDTKGEREYFAAASDLRDALQSRVPSYAALFGPAS